MIPKILRFFSLSNVGHSMQFSVGTMQGMAGQGRAGKAGQGKAGRVLWPQQTVLSSWLSSMFNGIGPQPTH